MAVKKVFLINDPTFGPVNIEESDFNAEIHSEHESAPSSSAGPLSEAERAAIGEKQVKFLRQRGYAVQDGVGSAVNFIENLNREERKSFNAEFETWVGAGMPNRGLDEKPSGADLDADAADKAAAVATSASNEGAKEEVDDPGKKKNGGGKRN